MKTINVLLLFVLIFAVSSELAGFTRQSCIDYAPDDIKNLIGASGTMKEQQAYSLDFCRSTDYTGYYRCCFLKYKKDSKRQYHCVPLSSGQFWDIKGTKDKFEERLEDIDSLDCSSSYLYVSLLLIFTLLF